MKISPQWACYGGVQIRKNVCNKISSWSFKDLHITFVLKITICKKYSKML